jgi:ketosteroid isomerase-like protein
VIIDGQVGAEEDLAIILIQGGYQVAHPKEDLVREGFAAFGRGDMDALRKQSFADDVRYHVPGRGPISGDYEGPEQVLQMFARVFELTGGTFSFELHDVLANDEHAATLFTTRGERAGKQLNNNMVQIYHFRDSKVSEVWAHQFDDYAVDEFYS